MGIFGRKKSSKSGMRHARFAEVAILSHIGNVRNSNEDNCCLKGMWLPEGHITMAEPIVRHVLFDGAETIGVFDGLGGEWFGETASFIASKTFAEADIQDLSDLGDTFRLAHDKVCSEKSARKAKRMGTTAVILRIVGQVAMVGSVGDSSCYLLRKGKLSEVTERDTNRELLESMGLYDGKPSLSRYLGMDGNASQLSPHLYHFQLKAGDVLLLASDGLTDELTEEDMSDISSMSCSLQERVSRLCRWALDKGGRDNITLALCEIA